MKTADCVPVLIGDPKTGAFAAIHAGWRGTVQSIVKKAVKELKQTYGSDPEDLIAAIGPAAGCSNYEIGQDVIAEFAENFVCSEKYFTATREGHALVDLHLANRDQLIDSGVVNENIFTAPFCTMERRPSFLPRKNKNRQNWPIDIRRPPRHIALRSSPLLPVGDNRHLFVRLSDDAVTVIAGAKCCRPCGKIKGNAALVNDKRFRKNQFAICPRG